VNEYKKLLFDENKQHIDFLNRRVEQTFQWLQIGFAAVMSLVAVLTFLMLIAGRVFRKDLEDFKEGIRKKTEWETKTSSESLLAEAKEHMKTEIAREIKAFNEVVNLKYKEIDSRADEADRADIRRREKYASTLKQVLDVVMEIPTVLSSFCGVVNDDYLKQFQGKKALWVDDDPVSSVLPVAILVRLGIQVTQTVSTQSALECDFSALQLIVSNMNREPIHDAGLKLARAIRNDHHCLIPIIIFTRPERIANYELEMRNLDVEYATEVKELVRKLAKLCSAGEPPPSTAP
jgi:CheY-like chemotaxis protein